MIAVGLILFLSQLGLLIASVPHVPNNQGLIVARPSGPGARVVRDGFSEAGDVPPMVFRFKAERCALNGGAGDGGSQVPSMMSGCWVADLPNVVDVRQWGARLDGVSNDAPALRAALAFEERTGGGTIKIPAGSLAVDSDTLISSRPFIVPSNVDIEGSTGGVSTILLRGHGRVSDLFYVPNPSNVWFKHLTFVGNSVNAGCSGCAGAIFFHGTINARSPMSAFGCRYCSFLHWNADYWVLIRNNSRQPMRDIIIDHPVVNSLPGDLSEKAKHAIGSPAVAFAFMGALSGQRGIVEKVWVQYGTADGSFLKSFCGFWSGVREAHCSSNELSNFGAAASNDVGSYTIFSYDNSRYVNGSGVVPSDIFVENNKILHPRSAGLYIFSAKNVTVKDNYCDGQLDINDNTLPKGCYAFNAAFGRVVIQANLSKNSYRGISVVPGSEHGPSIYQIQDNKAFSTTPSASGILIKASDDSTTADVRILDDISQVSGMGSTGLMFQSEGVKRRFASIKVFGGSYSGAYAGIRGYDTTTSGCALAGVITLTDAIRLAGRPSGGGIICRGTESLINLQDLSIDAIDLSSDVPVLELRGDVNARFANLRLKLSRNKRPVDAVLTTSETLDWREERNLSPGQLADNWLSWKATEPH